MSVIHKIAYHLNRHDEVPNQELARDIPIHSESILLAVNENNKAEFMSIIASRKSEMKPTQLIRLKKIFKKFDVEHR